MKKKLLLSLLVVFSLTTLIGCDTKKNESKPTTSPNKTAEQLNNSDADNYKGSSDKSVYYDTNNNYYYEGQEDDDDFEKIVLLPKVIMLVKLIFMIILKHIKFIFAMIYNTIFRNVFQIVHFCSFI